ncbi:MAG TPA: pyrroloquinoline quinone-dependent dehydrogenase [Phenylobacterium sp.]|uniref:pyrroloquinoline quinone-dependent dehydrogenase n=1 Tax=Phenylobacterium sp. TaxID=1871053 RepID=UPI002CEA482C|nr:pyrroloquinoline quinone-dependent dehydrogenase [Phenylobacterium sp.]HSV01781.1 pyrroloquinoline quinone-dependent dehydrogenase [Phenylobacterium sp.]
MRPRIAFAIAGLAAGLAALAALAQQPAPAAASFGGWSTFNGDLMAQKYAADAQITPANVGDLRKAWEVHTGDISHGAGGVPATDWSATPLFVNDTVYISTPFYRIFAIAPDTGRVKWIFDPHAPLKALTQPEMKTRGVAYWQAANPVAGQPCQKRVYVGTMDGKLYAVDADTGRACADFGRGGVVDVNQWNAVNPVWPLSLLQPPTVYKDSLFVGWAGKDWASKTAPPGWVFALDARTGQLKWTFNPLPANAWRQTGTSNVWASMSVDPKNGLLYLPVSSPSPNFYGGERKQALPYTTSITALNADTGQVVWARQLVHHDLWDYDINSAPTLVDIRKDGRTVPALVQSTKMGFIFVLDRLTGEPIYPIVERPAPASNVPGEQASPTQPYADLPAPVISERWPGVSTLADLVSFGECSRRAKQLRYLGKFTPPSLGAGSLEYPATVGGVEWGGGAVDPTSGTYVVNNSSVVMIYQLLTRQQYAALNRSEDRTNYYAQSGTPYGMHLTNFLNWLGMPCWKPPFGSITAYDLKTGRTVWREPFGVVQKWGFYMPRSWGSVTIGGPVITRTGVIFIGASMDSKVRALDERTGRLLWSAQVDAPAVALPAVYTYRGRQYVLFTAGGNSILTPRLGDQLVAFALP